MKWLNYGTKRQKQLVEAFRISDRTELYHCYKSPSADKYHAWLRCKQMCDNFNGYYLCITRYNSWTFSAAFIYNHPITGNVILCTITKDNVYFCDYM